MEATTSEAHPGPLQALLILVVMVPVIGALLALAGALHVEHMFAGFLFVLYWAGIKGFAGSEFMPALLGSLCGLGTAWLVYYLPKTYGSTGGIVLMAIIALIIYLLVWHKLSVIINNAHMLMLTVCAMPALQGTEHTIDMATAVLLSAAYAGGLLWIALQVGKWRAKRDGTAAPAATTA